MCILFYKLPGISMEYIFAVIIIIIPLLGVFFTFWFSKQRELRKDKKDEYKNDIQKISILSSPSEQIMKYDIILHRILKDYGYSWNVCDQLKAKPRMINNLNTIWSLHKLRNKLAHDMEPISVDLLKKNAQEFEKELLKLL